MKKLSRIGFGAALFSALIWSFGCVEAPSDEAALTPEASELSGKFVYKFSVDIPNGSLDVEPVTMGTAAATTHFGGVIDVFSSGCGAPGTIPNTCNITLKNKTPLLNLTNVRTWLYDSTSGSATIANADFIGATVVPDSPQNLSNSGLCIAEDGSWIRTSGLNQAPKGCATYTYGSPVKTVPYSIIHPDCGQVTVPWTFDTDSTFYTFYTALVDVAGGNTTVLATFRPEDMLSDPRGSFANYSTFVVKPYYLDAANCVGGCKAAYALTACVGNNNAYNAGYHLGAPQCSTPVNYNTPLANGTFFAVASGIEYSDRLEGQAGRVALNNLSGAAYCFEYSFSQGIIYSWDPTVLILQTVSTVTGAGTAVEVVTNKWLTSGTVAGQTDPAIMGRYVNEDSRFQAGASIVTPGANFLYLRRTQGTGLFGVQADPSQVTCRAGIWDDTAVTWAQANMWNSAASWFGMGTMAGNPCTLAADGVDAAVDSWIGLAYFQVIGASGTGSRIQIEKSSDFIQNGLNHSNCTTQGGYVGGSGDYLAGWCNPCAAGSTNLACGGAVLGGTVSCTGLSLDTGNQWVYTNRELTNPAMPGGPNSYKGRGPNAQNAHICVQ